MYSWIFKNILFPLYDGTFARRNTKKFLHDYSRNLVISDESLESLQLEKLRLLLSHAYQSCDYYHEAWRNLGFHPNDLQRIGDICQLPVIDKKIIEDNYDGFISKNFVGNNIKKATGGSSGVPFRFELNDESHRRREAVMWRGYGELGAGLGVRTLYLWGANISPVGATRKVKDDLYNKFYNRKILNSFNMSKNNLLSYVNEVNHFRAKAVVGYVNPLVTLSQFILDNDVSVHSPGAILTGAEPLYEFQREIIEQAFNAPVYNTYGCREFMLIGFECKHKKGFHLNSDHLLVETVSDEGDVTSGSGNIVITDFHNYGFPLIRYANGDRGTMGESCSCGLSLPLLKSVEGRKLDVIKTPDGKRLPGEFFPHFFKDFSEISQFQVIQEKLGEIRIKLVLKDKNHQQLINTILTAVQDQLGDLVKIEISVVEDIELSASGKRLVTISKVH